MDALDRLRLGTILAAVLATGGLAGCSGDDAGQPEEAQPIVVEPPNPSLDGSVSITFPTPYKLGDITPQAKQWAELRNRRRAAKGREPEPPDPVGGGDNYHVVLAGPWGSDCRTQSEAALGYFAEPGKDTLTVPVERFAGPDGLSLASGRAGRPGGRSWCPGTYSGRVEFRQSGINPGKVPPEAIGHFSFIAE